MATGEPESPQVMVEVQVSEASGSREGAVEKRSRLRDGGGVRDAVDERGSEMELAAPGGDEALGPQLATSLV